LPKRGQDDRYIVRARRYQDLRAFDRAVQDLQQAMDSSPDSLEAPNGLAWIWIVFVEGKLDDGIALATQTLERITPDSPPESHANLLDTLGWAYYRKGEFQRASELLKQATEMWPENLLIQEHFVVCSKEAMQPATA
jgi:tetratricopeptide (TPR) repeat protein